MHTKPLSPSTRYEPGANAGLELGVCYYPEQWDRTQWRNDANRMVALGLDWVRIGEFSWARVEPAPGVFAFEWLEEAVEILGQAGLRVIMGTPTAAPPKWLVDRHPDILPVDAEGRIRKFGARRHYCFSSRTYREQAARITSEFARRLGSNPFIHAWQIDNEYGDHDTIHSYSTEAAAAFRRWLEQRYSTVDALNSAWGTSFWSMHYNSFAEIDLPNMLVEEPTPTHLVDYYRFASDEVHSFNKLQVDIVRAHAPGRLVTHNFMSHNTDFDHWTVGADLDVASWDSYPMGGLLNGRLSEDEKQKYLRVGDPDQTSFNHDLYRAVGRGRAWVMEMQPGPVNWAAFNQSPADGMVRLWTWLAYAHGVDMVSYFRWRQAPFAQEQFHAGLLLPDGEEDQAVGELRAVIAERALVPDPGPKLRANTALVLDYPSRWSARALPQSASQSSAAICLDWYSALNRLGVDVDIIGQHEDVEGYALVLAPDLQIAKPEFIEALAKSSAKVLFGPRSGSKTEDMHIPPGLAGGPLGPLIDVRVERVESLPPYHEMPVGYGNSACIARSWRESIKSSAQYLATFEEGYRKGEPALLGNDRARYLATIPDGDLLGRLMRDTLDWAGVERSDDLGDVRITRRGSLSFAFNFGSKTAPLPVPDDTKFYLGRKELAAREVAVWPCCATA
ncbi:beta-galactosidase [Pelagibacterium sp.]|uniref:beta-galactosidase n=1 Tax=Pelagibacterium sp. TaxID=1967288 RepID=UPI003A959D0E